MNKYCFCIISDFNDNKDLIEGKELYVVGYKDVAMVVEDREVEAEDIFPTRDELSKHEEVIESIMEERELIPMSFGHVCKDKDEIKSFLSSNYNKLVNLFNKIEGSIEVGLKVFWTDESFSEEIEDQEIQDLKEQAMKDETSEQMEMAEVGKLVEEKVDAARQFYTERIYKRLADISADSKLNSIPNPKMILNSAFLVDESKEETFDKLVNDIYEEYEEKLVFNYTGPWPPYNFVEEEFTVE
ncbi:gas vesicle protein GvpF [Halanaerocella petrolearia]